MRYDGFCDADGRFGFESPIRLSDNTLSYLQRCAGFGKDGMISAVDIGRLLAYDLHAAAQQPPVFEGGKTLRWSPGYAFETYLDGVAIDIENRQVLASQNAKPGSVVLGELEKPNRTISTGFLQVWGISRANDGRVAFIARNGSRTEPPLRARASLYVARDMELRDPQELVSGVEALFGSGWSYDGKWLAFAGVYKGTLGLYVVSPDTKEVRLVAKGTYKPTQSSWKVDQYRMVQPFRREDGTWVLQLIDMTELLSR